MQLCTSRDMSPKKLWTSTSIFALLNLLSDIISVLWSEHVCLIFSSFAMIKIGEESYVLEKDFNKYHLRRVMGSVNLMFIMFFLVVRRRLSSAHG